MPTLTANAGSERTCCCSIAKRGRLTVLAAGADRQRRQRLEYTRRVYQFSSGSWTQIDSDIDSEAAGDNFGQVVGFLVATETGLLLEAPTTMAQESLRPRASTSSWAASLPPPPPRATALARAHQRGHASPWGTLAASTVYDRAADAWSYAEPIATPSSTPSIAMSPYDGAWIAAALSGSSPSVEAYRLHTPHGRPDGAPAARVGLRVLPRQLWVPTSTAATGRTSLSQAGYERPQGQDPKNMWTTERDFARGTVPLPVGRRARLVRKGPRIWAANYPIRDSLDNFGDYMHATDDGNTVIIAGTEFRRRQRPDGSGRLRMERDGVRARAGLSRSAQWRRRRSGTEKHGRHQQRRQADGLWPVPGPDLPVLRQLRVGRIHAYEWSQPQKQWVNMDEENVLVGDMDFRRMGYRETLSRDGARLFRVDLRGLVLWDGQGAAQLLARYAQAHQLGRRQGLRVGARRLGEPGQGRWAQLGNTVHTPTTGWASIGR